MKNIRQELSIWISTIGFVGIWLALVLLEEHRLSIGLVAVATLPHAVTLYVLVRFLFVRFAWRWRFFHPWLVPMPDLEGRWEGTLTSTWSDVATAARPEPIPATLFIRQTFSSVVVTISTAESTSHSDAARLSEDEAGGAIRLTYIYTNRPRATVRDHSAIHDGAATLVLAANGRELNGEYWTSRKTTGDMVFSFKPR
jgi:hypothetical protein